MRVRPAAAGVIIAMVASAYALVTPPMQVPDEVGHFWRANAIAQGAINPNMSTGRPTAFVPAGIRDLVAVVWVETGGHPERKVGAERIRRAWQLSLRRETQVAVEFPAFYTPVPYLPQIAAAFAGDVLSLKPLLIFYLCRLANAMAVAAIVAVAIRLAPDATWLVLAGAGLPMTLFLFGSCSADALTIALGYLATSAGLATLRDEAGRSAWTALTVSAFFLALCKPVYFALALPALCRRLGGRQRLWGLAVIATTAAGTALSAIAARRNYYAMRPNEPIDPATQLSFVVADPLRFGSVALDEYTAHWRDRQQQFVGQLGWLDVMLPPVLIDLMTVLLVVLALTTFVRIPTGVRIASGVAVLVSAGLITLSQYLVWTPVGADYVQGVQGRYFLPLVAAALLVLTRTRDVAWDRYVRWAFIALAVVLNAVGFARLLARYY